MVVVDNGSTDASVTVGRLGRRFRAVRWIDGSRIPGPGAARNAGVRAAGGDLLAFCDADDMVQPGWLAACVSALADADVAAGVFDFWSLNGLGIRPSSRPPPAAGIPPRRPRCQPGRAPTGLR